MGQDWYHESCLNLRPLILPKQENGEDDGEDEDEAVLIPSDTYDGLICATCVREHPLLRERTGEDGWMMIEPSEGGLGWRVVGRRELVGGEIQEVMKAGKQEEEDIVKEEVKEEKADGTGLPNGLKRSAEEEETEESAKKPRLNGLKVKEETAGEALKGAGDVFLAYGIRDQLKASLDVSCTSFFMSPAYLLPFSRK